MDKRIQKYGDLGVDIKLHQVVTTPEVFWSPRSEDGYGGCNSYVVVHSPEHGAFKLGDTRVALLSINGAGEVRWGVQSWEARYALEAEKEGKLNVIGGTTREGLLAMRHFGLELIGEE
jgi:hypothetical protein